MALLAGKNYDPSTAAQKSCTSRLAMTAFDTTNLRLTFTAPANGIVMVRIKCQIDGATTYPSILLGILEGATVIARQSPLGALAGSAAATFQAVQEALFTVGGLTPGNEYVWDAAYGIEILLSGSTINYGGPNNATADNAWGGLQFEIWEAPTCLGTILYDPTGGAAVSNATTSAIAMTAIDSTNLRITFNAPASGNVLVRLRGVTHGATTQPQILLGVLNSAATVIGRSCPIGTFKTTAIATGQVAREAQFVVTGLTPDAEYIWDAAYGVEVVVALTGLKYGGPDNTTTNDAFGGFLFEVWGA